MTEVVLYSDDAAAAQAEVAAAGGRVLQVLSPRVVIADLEAGVDLHTCTTVPPPELDNASRKLVQAWAAARAKRQTEPIPWDAPGFAPPD